MNSGAITLRNVMASQVVQTSVVSSSSSLSLFASKSPSFPDRLSSVSLCKDRRLSPFLRTDHHCDCDYDGKWRRRSIRTRRSNGGGWVVCVSNAEDTEVSATSSGISTSTAEQETDEPDPEDLEYVSQIKRVLERLGKNRDMTFNEIKLTVMIEDPRDAERRRLLGIDDENAPTRDDLADALEEVNKGKVPENRLALKMLAEEMISWPNLEEEAPRKKSPRKSLYAKATDTGIDPKEAAKRLNVDWDAAAEFEDEDDSDDVDVPPAVGYGALYLVTALPVIIGISVVLILFYNSLQ
ncbi:unnamed protein product [Coffea canephora]|uniref:Ycf3-interacting protein 1, chloroplastic n=1 Tax=Coffea canephora TaxID=49390 RepID=A0A068U6H1_COFCA|nr:unnamed protein product [Coffea canephora]